MVGGNGLRFRLLPAHNLRGKPPRCGLKLLQAPHDHPDGACEKDGQPHGQFVDLIVFVLLGEIQPHFVQVQGRCQTERRHEHDDPNRDIADDRIDGHRRPVVGRTTAQGLAA